MPPFLAPYVQAKPIVLPEVYATSLYRFIGASGLVRIIAPPPGVPKADVPTMFYALTYAKISEPHGIENGAIISAEIGTVQILTEYMDYRVPLHVAG